MSGKGVRTRLFWLALALPALVGGACDERVQSGGCEFDGDCPVGHACEDGRCLAPGADAGPAYVDGGVVDGGARDGGSADAGPAVDGGPSGCAPDPYDNGTTTKPYPLQQADGGTGAAGHMCPSVGEHFSFFGQDPADLVHIVARWKGEVDLDVALYSPSTASAPSYASFSASRSLEAVTTTLNQAGAQLVALYDYDADELAVPSEGVDYEIEVRSGRRCLVDADCAPFEGACLMPIWVPFGSTGDPPFQDEIFAGGMCAPVYVPCNAADSLSAEGLSDRRSNAIDGTPTDPAWSCALDEDWYRHVAPATGDVTIGFANAAQTPGTFILSVHDAVGNMIAGDGWDGLPQNQTRTVVVPKVHAGRELFIRVMQLNDNDAGLYTIGVGQSPGTCAGDADCAADGTRRYGRTRCLDGACECVDNPIDPGVCTPQ